MTDPNQQPVTPPEQPAAPAHTAPAAPNYSQPAAPAGGGYAQQPYAAGPAAPSKVLSLISMIAGIVGVVLAFAWGSGILFSIAAIVLGFMGKKKEAAARLFWLTGLITGWVGIGIAIIVWIITIVGLIALANTGINYSY